MNLDLELYRKAVRVEDYPPVQLSLIDVGPEAAGRTIVFIHGFAGHVLQWHYQLRVFADENRVIAMDLRGHGLSDKPRSTYDVAEFVRDLSRMLEALHVSERFILIGHSFGGAVALTYASEHPERIEKLVLIGVPTRFHLQPKPSLALKIPDPAFTVISTIMNIKPAAPAYVLKTCRENSLDVFDGGPLLPLIKVPTLVIMGQRDTVFGQDDYQQVADKIPGAQTVTVPVSAHLVQLERSDAVNRAIQRFIGPAPHSAREARAELTRQRPWLAHYEPGVPPFIDIPDQPLHVFLTNAARRYPDQTALVFYEREMSYQELDTLANRFANALRHLGVNKGDRVLILLPNMPQCVIAFYGALKAGAVVVLGNPLSSKEDIEHQLRDSGAETVVTLSLFFSLVQQSRGADPSADQRPATTVKRVIVTSFKEYLPARERWVFEVFKERQEGHQVDVQDLKDTYEMQPLLHAQPSDPPQVETSSADIALIQYTGGTSDTPKGVLLTHKNLVANVIQIRHWLGDSREGREVVLCVLPFSHSYGLTACLNLSVTLAATMVLLPTFTTVGVLKAIKRHHPTIFPGVPAMYLTIANYPRVRAYGVSSIRICISGAAPLPLEVQEAFEKLTKGRLSEGYGLTEASPVTHVNPVHGLRRPGSIGLPLPSTEAKIINPETGETLPADTPGELCVRGPQVMLGYWNMPEETARVLSPDGWLRTGDIARMDADGYCAILDRKKDMILAGPYNVYPRDVEEVLYEHPKVLEAAVVGIPAAALALPLAPVPVESSGPEALLANASALTRPAQQVKACVVVRPGEHVSAEELLALCRTRLEAYKVPQAIEFWPELPKTIIGKVLRRLLV